MRLGPTDECPGAEQFHCRIGVGQRLGRVVQLQKGQEGGVHLAVGLAKIAVGVQTATLGHSDLQIDRCLVDQLRDFREGDWSSTF